MTQYFSTIASSPIQSGPPPDWTYVSPAGYFSVVANSETIYTDRVIACIGAPDFRAIHWNPPGSNSWTEILVLMKYDGATVNNATSTTFHPLVGTSTDSQFTGFQASVSANPGAFDRLGVGRGTFTASTTFALNCGQWVWVRALQHWVTSGNANHYCKAWLYGTTEPAGWMAQDLSIDRGPFSDYPGLVSFANDPDVYVAFFSVGTNGDPAPSVQTAQGAALFSTVGSLRVNADRFGNKITLDPLALRGAGLLKATGKLPADSQLSFRPSAVGNLTVNVKSTADLRVDNQTLAISGALTVDTFIPLRQSFRYYTGDHYVRRDKDDYAEALANLLPIGPAWPREPDRILQKFVGGQAGIWGGVVEDAAELLLTKESDPRTTVQILDWWERAWGLPDKCVAEPLTIYDRQRALIHKMTLLGGQSRQFFIDAAAYIGYTIAIREYAPWMCGISHAGDTRDAIGYYRWEIGRPEMRFYWSIRIGSTRFTWFRCSSGQAGIDHHLEFARATDLECILNRWKPAHTEIVFDYSPTIAADFAQPFNTDYYMLLSMM